MRRFSWPGRRCDICENPGISLTFGMPAIKPRSGKNDRTAAKMADDVLSPNASLESTVLAVLRMASKGPLVSATAGKPLKRMTARDRTVQNPLKAGLRAAPVDPGKLTSLGAQSRRLHNELYKQGLLRASTVRIRPKGEIDRRFVVEYAIDPDGGSAVLFRISPASPTALPQEKPRMLTTQQAADQLNVSRPYVTRLVDQGEFVGVERTRSGHRRIPAAEVKRVGLAMRAVRRTALGEMQDLTADLRARELAAAKKRSKQRWAAKHTA
jgi:excisionase family DNA binding protein